MTSRRKRTRSSASPGLMTTCERTCPAGPYHGDPGCGEVIACAQDGVAGLLGERVSEAVAEIQPGQVPAFAVLPPAAHRAGGQVRVDGHDVDACVTQEAVDDILAGRPQPGLDDDAQLDADGGSFPADMSTGQARFVVTDDLLRCPAIGNRQGGHFGSQAGQSRPHAARVPGMLPVEPLPQRGHDRLGQRLPGFGGQFPGKPVRLLTFMLSATEEVKKSRRLLPSSTGPNVTVPRAGLPWVSSIMPQTRTPDEALRPCGSSSASR